MSFTFDATIPAAGNNPSNDQPKMLANNVSTNGILAVDHVTFNTANGGQHLQVTFNSKNIPALQTDPQSVLYTNSGTASSVSQLLYINQNAVFQISAIRAWAFCGTAGIIASQSFNVAAVTRLSAGKYTVTLTANVVSSANFAVLCSCTINNTVPGPGTSAVVGYVITGTGAFQLNFLNLNGVFTDPASFSFQVLQI